MIFFKNKNQQLAGIVFDNHIYLWCKNQTSSTNFIGQYYIETEKNNIYNITELRKKLKPYRNTKFNIAVPNRQMARRQTKIPAKWKDSEIEHILENQPKILLPEIQNSIIFDFMRPQNNIKTEDKQKIYIVAMQKTLFYKYTSIAKKIGFKITSLESYNDIFLRILIKYNPNIFLYNKPIIVIYQFFNHINIFISDYFGIIAEQSFTNEDIHKLTKSLDQMEQQTHIEKINSIYVFQSKLKHILNKATFYNIKHIDFINLVKKIEFKSNEIAIKLCALGLLYE